MIFNLNLTQNNNVSCSASGSFFEGQHLIEFNDAGPVYGPNGEWELDPDNNLCGGSWWTRPVFATCKNNCPGGELFSNNYKHQQINSMFFVS